MKDNLENMKTRETVIFNQVSLNEGNAYDTTSGKFTAPIDGVFFFSWGILTDNGKYFVSKLKLFEIASQLLTITPMEDGRKYNDVIERFNQNEERR